MYMCDVHCTYFSGVFLHCLVPGGACTTGSIRLVGGTAPYRGRVEVCVNGTWGTVTDDAWNDRDARVVCRQMNFSTAGQISPE